ncbi:class F sortase [Streptomyces sp. NPDC059171]|uniref:class F sortase n=1 Tax=Streptomyces sp. NPDC059171 TaxID=3346755 RepID=UPI00369A3F1B
MILRLVLGLLLAAMALGQAASFDAMPAILTTYGLTSGAASTALAVALISAEAVTALWFLTRPRSRATTPVWLYTAVAVAWSALASQAFARRLVQALRQYEKDTFPDSKVYATTGPPALHLITCSGTYDRARGEYRSNLVIYATTA